MTKTSSILILVAFASVVLIGCKTQSAAPLAEYGYAGPGTIAVLIGGEVTRPGRYHIEDGTTLAGVTDLFGGLRSCGTCGLTPSRVFVFRDGKQLHRYSLSKTNDLEAIRLEDGDTVRYATTHF